jgi:hypothetical protein
MVDWTTYRVRTFQDSEMLNMGAVSLSPPVSINRSKRRQELVLDIQKASGMDCDFLGAWRKALDSVEALGTARNVYVKYEDWNKHEDSDGDATYKPGRIYRRRKRVKAKKVKTEGQ